MPVLLAIVPHPDDESYAFGGTIALAARAGWRCIVHCVSSGEGGKRHDGGPPDPRSLLARREDELAESCRVLGAEPPFFWHLPDGGLATHRAEFARVAALLSRSVDVVLAPGSDGAYGHPDHIAVHRWVAAGWRAAQEKRPALLFAAFPPGLFLPQYRLCAGMMGDPPQPAPEAIGSPAWDYEVDAGSVLGAKIVAVGSHRSQLPGGDPYALFPPGVLAGCLPVEHFTLAPGSPLPEAFLAATGAVPSHRHDG